MTRTEFAHWVSKYGYLNTIQGRKYIQVHKIMDEPAGGFLGTVMSIFWGLNDWRIAFSLCDDRPMPLFLDNAGGYTTTEYEDGSKNISNGEIAYFIPPGKELPVLSVHEYSGPLQSFRPLESNIRLLTEFVNKEMQNKKSF